MYKWGIIVDTLFGNDTLLWCYVEAFVTLINNMNNDHFSFQEQYFLILLRIKWLIAQQKRVNTFKGRTLAQQVNRLSSTFQHALWL